MVGIKLNHVIKVAPGMYYIYIYKYIYIYYIYDILPEMKAYPACSISATSSNVNVQVDSPITKSEKKL